MSSLFAPPLAHFDVVGQPLAKRSARDSVAMIPAASPGGVLTSSEMEGIFSASSSRRRWRITVSVKRAVSSTSAMTLQPAAMLP